MVRWVSGIRRARHAVNVRIERREGNAQPRTIGRVAPQIATVHSRAVASANLDAAQCGLNRLAEPYVKLTGYGCGGDDAADGRIGSLEPRMRDDIARQRHTTGTAKSAQTHARPAGDRLRARAPLNKLHAMA